MSFDLFFTFKNLYKVLWLCYTIFNSKVGEVMENREALIESAKKYYDYLDANNKGIISYTVRHVERLTLSKSGFFYRLKMNSKLSCIDELQLQVFDKVYKKLQTRIELYDEENKTIVMYVSDDIIKEVSDLAKLRVDDIKVVYDLKFLVKNVQKLFEKYPLLMPNEPSIIEKEDDVKIFNDCSEEQVSAVKTALTKNISYIWGAPGTGKTQYVLTNAVLNYTVRNKKVIIVAPTNNAIEQVMSSLIKVTDDVGISRSKIIRLGTPTKDFFNKYPEVCEKEKLWRVLSVLNGRINILDEVLKYKEKKSNHELYKDRILEELNTLRENMSGNEDLDIRMEELKDDLDDIIRKEESANLNYDSILAEKRHLINSLKTNADGKDEIDLKIASLSKQEEALSLELAQLRSDKKELKSKIKELKQTLQKVSLPAFRKSLKAMGINISAMLSTFDEIEMEVQNQLRQIEKEIALNTQMYSEYENDTEDEIREKLENLLSERMETYQKSTQARIDSALIMGMTLDMFVSSRLSYSLKDDLEKREEPLAFDAEHIFLDEAGYSSLEKALAIFTTKQPITLLGDHFQLPPVCELDEIVLNESPELSLWLQSSLYALEFLENDVDTLASMYSKKSLPDFEELNKRNLTRTYRFGQNLLDILSADVYKVKMQSAPNRGNIEILYINAPRVTMGAKKRENLDEARKIYEYALRHYDEDIAILTPYRNQVFELKKRCRMFGKDGVMTIHGAQGQEWDTVILSVCDTFDRYFTDSCNPKTDGKRILNTAISRVKKRLIIVCDYNYWVNETNQLIGKLLKVASPCID